MKFRRNEFLPMRKFLVKLFSKSLKGIKMLEYENKAKSQGYNLIAGMDEAGRGPLAGAVYTAMCIMPLDDLIDGVNDSKALTPKKREELYEKIKEKAVAYVICSVDEKRIDEINILEATKEGMAMCLDKIDVKPDYCLVDHVAKINLDVPFETIVKGDAKSYSIACASILAKVARDRYIEELDKKYPNYKLSQHKGYATKLHYELINKFGVSEIHRKSFLKNLDEHR